MDDHIYSRATFLIQDLCKYWLKWYVPQNGLQVKFVGEIRGSCLFNRSIQFLLLSKLTRNQRSDKYILGQKDKFRLVNSRSKKVILLGPEIEGSDSKIRTEHFRGYYSTVASSLDLDGQNMMCFNLATRQHSPQHFPCRLLNYFMGKQTVGLVFERKIEIRNRLTNQLDSEIQFDYEITTGFCWVGSWYLILPKNGNFVELVDFKSRKRTKIKFPKLHMGIPEKLALKQAKVVPQEDSDINLGCVKIQQLLFIISNNGGISVVDLEQFGFN